jgi:hypothetical protein
LDPKQFLAGITQNNACFFMMWGPEVYQVGWDVEETIEAELVSLSTNKGTSLYPMLLAPLFISSKCCLRNAIQRKYMKNLYYVGEYLNLRWQQCYTKHIVSASAWPDDGS